LSHLASLPKRSFATVSTVPKPPSGENVAQPLNGSTRVAESTSPARGNHSDRMFIVVPLFLNAGDDERATDPIDSHSDLVTFLDLIQELRVVHGEDHRHPRH